MFYYYGAKARIARKYPPPRHPTIIEPFAGSAGYSMWCLEHDLADRAILIEKDARVVNLWNRLLAMTPEKVMEIPVPAIGTRTDDFFYMTSATSNGIGRSHGMTVTNRMPDLIEMMKRKVARLLPKVTGRVEVVHGSYVDAPNLEATWFIDPPYQPHAEKDTSRRTSCPQGMGYGRGCTSDLIDYGDLGAWCKERAGFAIVAEQDGALWLPFVPLIATQNSVGVKRREVVWTSEGSDSSLF